MVAVAEIPKKAIEPRLKVREPRDEDRLLSAGSALSAGEEIEAAAQLDRLQRILPLPRQRQLLDALLDTEGRLKRAAINSGSGVSIPTVDRDRAEIKRLARQLGITWQTRRG
jgi:hypothetical protein